MHGRWRSAVSSIFAGMSRKGGAAGSQEGTAPCSRPETIARMKSSGSFTEQEFPALAQHFARLPSSYCQAGFTPEQIREHVEVAQRAEKLKEGFVALRLVESSLEDDSSPDATASDSSCSSFGGFSVLSSDTASQVCKFEVSFACGAHVCRPQLASALRQAGISVITLCVFDLAPKGSLGHMAIKVYREDFSRAGLEQVFHSVVAAREPSPSKLFHVPTPPRRASGDLLASPAHLRLCEARSPARFPSPLSRSSRRGVTPSSSADVEGVLQILGGDRASRRAISQCILDPLKLELGPPVATGASGEVRKGVYEGKPVAVKILKSSLRSKDGDALVAEFRREVLALMACGGSPFLLKFYGVLVDVRSRMCIVTKFMEGGTLHHYLQKRNGRPLPLAEVLRIAQDIACGMDFLHRNGITHRDLKSANVMLDGEGHAVIGDFGVAKLKGERGEMTKEVGTYRWMAPEAFGTSAWPVTHKSDVYSYGIVLWELLSLTLPFESYTPLQAAVAVTLNGLRPAIPESCPRELKALIERCWAKNPDERPEFSEVLLALRMLSVALLDPALSPNPEARRAD